MRRPSRKFERELVEVDGVALFEGVLANAVLLLVVGAAQADCPAVGGFEGKATVGAAADMGAFDGAAGAAGHAAMVAPHPGAVGGAGSPVTAALGRLKPLGQA